MNILDRLAQLVDKFSTNNNKYSYTRGYTVLTRQEYEECLETGWLCLPVSGRRFFFDHWRYVLDYIEERSNRPHRNYVIGTFALDDSKITNECGHILEYNYPLEYDETFLGVFEITS